MKASTRGEGETPETTACSGGRSGTTSHELTWIVKVVTKNKIKITNMNIIAVVATGFDKLRRRNKPDTSEYIKRLRGQPPRTNRLAHLIIVTEYFVH